MHVLALRIELKLPGCRSLKDKRAALRPVVEGIRHRFEVSVAEVDHQDTWQHAEVGVAIVSPSVARCEDVADAIERWVWSRGESEVVVIDRHWLDLA